MTLSVEALISMLSEDEFLALGLELAAALELPVTSWRDGDPTRTYYHFLARALARYDGVNAEFVKSGFLDDAEGDWLALLAYEVYGVTKQEDAAATPTVTFTNTGGGVFSLEAGQLVVKSELSGQTYHNAEAFALTAGETATFDFEADDPGANSSVSANDVDTIVAPSLLGVTIVSSTASLGADGETDAELRVRCRASVPAFSPASPLGAYEYVALSSALTGNTSINRAKAYGNDDGTVTIYVATLDGAADAAAVTAAQNAVLEWATPLTVRPTASSAAVEAVTMTVTIRRRAGFVDSLANITEALTSVVEALFASTPIGNEGEDLAESVIVAAIHATYPDKLLSVGLSTGDIALATNEVPSLSSLAVVEA